MKNRIEPVLVAIIVIAGAFFTRATADGVPKVRIAKFDGDRVAAISYTFDDNLRDQYTIAAPMLDEFGIKGTFFVIAGLTAETPEEGERKRDDRNMRKFWGGISWPELRDLADRGHEIANHTWSHPALTKLSPEDLDMQIRKARETIEARVGKAPLTIAFPGNGSNPEVRAAALRDHVAFRSYQQSISGKSTVRSLEKWTDRQVREGNWGILMIHGISEGYASLTDPGILRAHLGHVKGREAEIWIDTFANVARYARERDDATLSVAGGSGEISVTLRGTLDPAVYDVPLTLVVEVDGARAAKAVRGKDPIPTTVRDDSILVRAAPGADPIRITWK